MEAAMRHDHSRGRLALAVGGALLSLLASCARIPPQGSSREAAASSGIVTATCHAVDTKDRTLTVITGVGYATRIVKFQIDPSCEIKVQGSSAKLEDLEPGGIVRVRYAPKGGRDVAMSIESVNLDRVDRTGVER